MNTLLKVGLFMACVSPIAVGASPLIIESQGSFAAGGTVIEAKATYNPYEPKPEAQSLHGDHAYVSYQIPYKAKAVPLVFLHGAGQFSKTWDTTPDGREGFKTLFLRERYPVYVVDQPRRGAAGRSVVSGQINATPDEGFWFGQFRMGLWPNFYEKSQFPQDKESINQFFRQMTPNTAPYDALVNAKAMTEVLKKSGPSVLVTHSQGCGVGWITGMMSENLKGIVAYEAASGFVFPKGEVPAPIENSSFFGTFKAGEVSLEDFKKFTRYPIVLYYGDFIPSEPSKNPHTDYWRAAVKMAHLWADCVNKYGGNAQVVELPKLGIYGNSHFMFAEKNNVVVAQLLETWLEDNVLKTK